jgi:predicted SAM-dependent methyltransferase
MNYQRLYSYRFAGVDQEARAAVWRALSPFFWEQMGKPERVLDPAAGRGEFINSVSAAERWAVDQVAYEEGTYAPAVKQIVSNIFDANLPEQHFGGIFVSNFLEHLLSQESVADFLERMYHATAPGGRIVIMGPNFRYCAKQYFDMADHTVVLTHRGVAEHLYASGYTIERVAPQFLPYSFTGKLPPSVPLVELYLKSPWAWRLLGKQFLVVGRRT